MMALSVYTDIEQAIKKLDSISGRQLPFILARGLTMTGQQVKTAERETIRTVFNRPTPFTVNSPMLKPATKYNLEAIVWLKDFAPKGTAGLDYLMPQIIGGARKVKRFERQMRNYGLLPPGMFVVPGAGAKLDQYGNIPGSKYVQILSAVGASSDSYQNRTSRSALRNKKQSRYFVVKQKRGRLRPGVYEIVGDRPRIILAFVKQPAYEAIYPFFEVAKKVARENFLPNVYRVAEDVLRGAR